MHMLEPNDQLRAARMSKKLSRAKLASHLGISHSSVARWELGETRPSEALLAQLCEFFGLSAPELGFPEISPTPNAAPLPRSVILDPLIPQPPSVGLVGREHILKQVKGRLCSGEMISLTSLNGLPGVGKTTLAAAVARDADVQAHFADGILWAGLGPNPNLPGILSRWAALLGLSTAEMATLGSIEEWTKALRSAIGARAMLLVIDDAWTVEDALTFRIGGANCTHFVTTRFPPIATHLTASGAVLLQELNVQDSVRLLSKLAPGTVMRKDQHLLSLIAAVGGLPLALTLIGNYLRSQVYSGRSRRIQGALQQLTDATVRMRLSDPQPAGLDIPGLQTATSLSLESVIAVTDQLLTPSVRATFYALSILPAKPDSFSEQTALAVTGCSTDDLDTLSDAGLLESSGLDRYALHQVLADYARLQLPATSREASADRLINYVIEYVRARKKDYELLEVETSTILIALDLAHEYQRQGQLVQSACLFAPFLILRGFYTLAEEHLQHAHEVAAELGDEQGLTGTLLYLGEIALKRGDLVHAEAYFQEGLLLARKIQHNERICELLTNLGSIFRRKGEFTQAEEVLQEALGIARERNNLEYMGRMLKLLGTVAGSQGKLVEAEQYFEEGLSISEQMADREQVCSLLSNLGVIAGESGNTEQAHGRFKHALQLARQIGHRDQICMLLINLGNIANYDKDFVQAGAYFEEGLELARQIQNQEWISILLSELAFTRQQQGLFEQSSLLFQESLKLAKTIGQPRILCNTLYLYGGLLLDQQQPTLAEECFGEMLREVPEGDRQMYALAHYGLGRVAAARKDLAQARQLGRESLELLEQNGYVKALEVRSWLESLDDRDKVE